MCKITGTCFFSVSRYIATPSSFLYFVMNYFQGYLGSAHTYIATQAPLDNTRHDFWQMVWEQNTEIIVMLTGLEEHGMVNSCFESKLSCCMIWADLVDKRFHNSTWHILL